jgi:hypothetical protein
MNGKLQGGRHIHFDRKTVTTGNLLLSILDMYDIYGRTGRETAQAGCRTYKAMSRVELRPGSRSLSYRVTDDRTISGP